MAKKATTTTTADTAVEALTGAALTSAKALVKLGDDGSHQHHGQGIGARQCDD